MAFYAVVLTLYLLFDEFALNYRPVILPGKGLEPSYPSTHTLISCCVCYTAPVPLWAIVGKKPKLYTAFCAACAVIPLLTIVSRVLSGVHWITDIIGGLLLSATLILFYFGAALPQIGNPVKEN